jgi:hypothetical protein
MGLIDLGLWEFAQTQSTSAARDGARQGILDPTDTAAVNAAVAARLDSGQTFSLTVTCVQSSSLTPVTGGCANAIPDNDDRIRVQVSWTRQPLTFVGKLFGPANITGESIMTISSNP